MKVVDDRFTGDLEPGPALDHAVYGWRMEDVTARVARDSAPPEDSR